MKRIVKFFLLMLLSIMVNRLQRQRWHITVFRLERQVRTVKHNAKCFGYMASLLTGHVFSRLASDVLTWFWCFSLNIIKLRKVLIVL